MYFLEIKNGIRDRDEISHCGMQDFHEKEAEMQDQELPFQTLVKIQEFQILYSCKIYI